MNNTGNSNKFDNEIGLKELFDILWNSKRRIILITTMFAITSVVFSILLPNKYTAVAILAPAQSDNGGLSSTLGQLSGLASLAVVDFGSGEITESQIAQEIMTSWSFIETFINQNDLAVKIYASDGWDKKANKIRIDNEIYDANKKKWLIDKEESNEFRPPTSWELFKRFKRMLLVSEDKKTGLVSVSIQYFSPYIAKEWVDLYVAAINEHMQARQVKRVSNNIDYLEAQIEKTSITEMREVFYTIIEEQTKNKMVAEASPDYVFVTVNPSMAPEEKSQPKRALICIVGTLIGGIIAVITVLIRHFLSVHQTQEYN